jgi:IclR family acetate operon transcriptional repressor
MTSREQVKAHLVEVRRQGYALDREEFQLGLCCVGAPVHSAAGEVIAAISISGLAAQTVGGPLEGLIKIVRTTADTISKELGYLALPQTTVKAA